MPTFAFLLILFIPHYGGEVRATIQLTDEASCETFRRVVAREIAGLTIKASIGPCVKIDET